MTWKKGQDSTPGSGGSDTETGEMTLQEDITHSPVLSGQPMGLSIVVISSSTRDATRKCLDTAFRYPPRMPSEVIVVDIASHDGSVRMVAEEYPQARLRALRGNRGPAGGCNEGVRLASGRYVLLLDSPACITPGALASTLSFMENNPAVGVLGCRLEDKDGTLLPCAGMRPGHLNKLFALTGLAARFPGSRLFGRAHLSWWDHQSVRKVDWIPGAFFLVRIDVFNSIGLLDEEYFPGGEKLDFCRSAAAYGWDVIFFPNAQVVSMGRTGLPDMSGASSRGNRPLTEQRIRNELRYYRKWHGQFKALISAFIELSCLGIGLLKTLFSLSPGARDLRQDHLDTIKLIVSLLMEDRSGKA
jgi:GT2 family glycosyltransferase